MNDYANKPTTSMDSTVPKKASFGKRKTLLVLIDVACFAAAYLLTVGLVLFSDSMIHFGLKSYLLNACVVLAFLMLGRFLLSVYRNVWRYPNVRAYLTIAVSDVLFGSLALLTTRFLPGAWGVNVGFAQTFMVVTFFDLATLLNRFCYQLYHQYKNATEGGKQNMPHKIGVAIVGAGQVGIKLAEELIYHANSHYRPICFIECDRGKIGAKVCGLPVYGDDDSLFDKLKSLPVQEIFIALANITSERAAELYKFYSRTGCKVKLYDFPLKDAETEADGDRPEAKRQLREMRIEDLLFRDSLVIKDEKADAYYRGKTVLVTGGGGSIGSELCRQVAKCRPGKLIILDIYENNAYTIQQELIRKYGEKLDLAVEIASVRDVARLDCIFRAYRPQVVFHAAAHKHVPLMEHSACEAVKNNVMGTYHTANAAEKYGAEKFILISTDKAVNHTNIMGASKRMCEMVVQCRHDSQTSFSAVRFGNVLGSNGSVIPLFREQIEKGGPVTVTDKRIIRYFMTIPEAARLVMQAGSMAKSGELFVLNMGKPVRILDLAENMIRLSGLTPYQDIDIVEIGLRPGEKLYEELLMKSETLSETENNLIFIEKDKPCTRAEVEGKLDVLQRAVLDAEQELTSYKIKQAMKAVVPTYRDPEEVNKTFDESEEKKLSEDEVSTAPAAAGAAIN